MSARTIEACNFLAFDRFFDVFNDWYAYLAPEGHDHLTEYHCIYINLAEYGIHGMIE